VNDPTVTLNIELRIRQKISDGELQDAQLFDRVQFDKTKFADCAKIMERFHRLGEQIKAEQVEVQP
jgi:hypothetical protein